MRVVLRLLVLLLLPVGLQAQARPPAGPVIFSAGAVFEVPDPGFATRPDMVYRLAFEMARPVDEPGQVNVVINSAARYLNMHVQAGVPRDQVDAAVVVHGGAGWELLGNAAYKEKFGVDNGNVALIKELSDAGVQVILCGQTAASRGIPTDGLADGVQVALSAMTAFLVLQEDGFRVNPW